MSDEAQRQSVTMLVVRVFLALALLGSLWYAGLRVYRSLPADDIDANATANRTAEASVRLVVRNSIRNATLHSPIELYQFNLAAARREFDESPRLAKQFDDFLARRMHDIIPVKAEVTADGVASTLLTRGDWWLRAIAQLDTGEQIEWRLPLTIRDRDQVVELAYENSYERTKKF